jgi:glycosyltransferase involved in cell wall biosynthesis
MRVLHLNGGNMYGGVETVLSTLAREGQAAPGMVSEFALCVEGRLSAELRAIGRPPHLLGAARLSRPQTIARVRRALAELIRSESFDVVVCHQPWTCVVFAPVIRAAGLPVVLWVHMASRGRHWLERLCRFTRPDLVVCNSRFTADSVSAWLPTSQIEHVYAPLSTQRSSPYATGRAALRAAVQTDDKDVVLVQVSRLEALKGHRVLLAALGTLRDLPGWRCWIVGGAQSPAEIAYLHELHNLMRRHGLSERVRFAGERHDVLDVMCAADIYCQPNTEPEGFGLTFVEAMYAGLPVVTSGIGGACEIVDGSCGILTPPGDVAALSSALRRLILDRDLNARLGAEARRRAEVLCHVPRQMRKIEAVLGSLSAPRSAAGHSVEVGST